MSKNKRALRQCNRITLDCLFDKYVCDVVPNTCAKKLTLDEGNKTHSSKHSQSNLRRFHQTPK